MKNTTQQPLNWNRPVQLIIVGNSIWLKYGFTASWGGWEGEGQNKESLDPDEVIWGPILITHRNTEWAGLKIFSLNDLPRDINALMKNKLTMWWQVCITQVQNVSIIIVLHSTKQ